MVVVPRMSYSPEVHYVLMQAHELRKLLKSIAVGGFKGMYCCYAESGFVTWDLELALEVSPIHNVQRFLPPAVFTCAYIKRRHWNSCI